MSNTVEEYIIEPLKQFFKDSSYLVKKCTKPDHKGIFIVFLCLNQLKKIFALL